MKNVKQLTKCVAALKNVRRNMQDGADRRILATLDEAIAKLQCCVVEENVDDQGVERAAMDALAVISDILTCFTTIAELMKFFAN
jgi:hypothetical protein